MLYHFQDQNRATMAPWANFAAAAAALLSNPVSPLAHLPYAQRVAAGFALLHRIGKDYEKPKFDIASTQMGKLEVAVEIDEVSVKPFCKLLHFRKQSATVQPKVLLTAPLSGHHATLLRDTVIALLPDHDVYITDWIDARMVPVSEGPFHLHDYVYYIQDFIRQLGPDLHLISVCQPTVPVLAAVALMATAGETGLPLSMTLMGGPVDTRISPTKVDDLATEKDFNWFKNNVIYTVPERYPGHGRQVYPGFLQHTAFISMNADRHAQSYRDYYEAMAQDGSDASTEQHRRFYDEYNAVLDMPAEFYLETIQVVFQEHRLAQGTWEVEGKPVRPQDITGVALLTVEGELDDITGKGQTQAAAALCSGIPEAQREHLTVPQCGHFGIFSGRRWHEQVCPRIAAFIKANERRPILENDISVEPVQEDSPRRLRSRRM